VTGVDFAPRAIEIARRKVKGVGVHADLWVRDATKLQGIDGPFDFALDLGCFHGIPQGSRTKYLEQLDRVLAPSGYWLMYGFLKQDTNHAGTGLAEADIARISSKFNLISRREGVDNGRGKPSAWFLFQKP
jgi:ubiquinone/menaquinone biosynthesis C-methylase UbiE